MSAKWKVILLVMLIIAATSSVLLYLFVTDNRAYLNDAINKDIASIQGIVETLGEESHRQYRKRIISLVDYDNFPEREKVLAAFAARDRAELLRLTRPFWDRLREENPDFSSFTWLTPDNRVFLRVFKPTVHGDDISHMRPDIVATNSRHVQNSGFMVSHTGLEYRVVQPVYYRGKYVGAVQFGLKDSMLPDAIHEKLEIPVALVIPSELFSFVHSSSLPFWRSGAKTLQSRHIDFFKGVDVQIDWKRPRQPIQTQNRNFVLAEAYDLLDFRGRSQGRLFVALDITSQQNRLQARIVFIMILTAGLLCASFVLLYRSYGGLVEKIVSLNRTLEDSNQRLEERVIRRTHQLRESEERFKTVLDSLPANVFVSDAATSTILFMNQHMIREYGQDLTGSVCWRAFRNNNAPCRHCPELFSCDGGKGPEETYTWDEENSITGKHYINYGRFIKWVDDCKARLHVATDITEMKKLEEQLRQNCKMEAVGVMAGGIAHNFNNSLAIIMGSLEMAERKASDAVKLRKYIENAKMAAQRSRDLVSQILTYSRRSDHQIEPIFLEPVVDETQKLLRSTLPATVSLVYELPSYARAFNIKADASQIQEILLNLCNNSVQAMDEKGLLTVRLDSVRLSRADIPGQYDCQPGTYVRISVRDSGCGIDPAVRDRIFDPFFTTKSDRDGTGMGLATVQAIVERHQGLIKVSSEVGRGTTFELYFPLQFSVTGRQGVEDPQMIPGGNERILLVDDEPIVTELESHMLTELGYHVHSATSGHEALKMVDEDPEGVDLIITDQTMPNMSGMELIAEVRKRKPAIRTILCTGYSSAVSSEQIEKHAIDAFVMKPLVLSELGQIVRGVLDGERSV